MENKVMTEQEVFDTVLNHLKTQGKQALNSQGKCCYRAVDKDGNKLMCAAGVLIPDEQYKEDMEECTIGNLVATGEIDVPSITANATLVDRLQILHDSYFQNGINGNKFRIQVDRIAERHGLTVNI